MTVCDVETSSDDEPADNALLSREDMKWFWDRYVPGESDRAHPDASPLRADDLSNLPPAYVITNGHEVLADESRAYAERLAEDGCR